MKRNHIAVLFFLVSLVLASCSKFSNGDVVTETREIAPRFNAICMYNNVNVKLVQSDQPHLELTCPKNLIDKVTTEFSPSGDTLIIKNENTLNWLRSYDYSIDLTVYYNALLEINYASIGDLRCSDPIEGYSVRVFDPASNEYVLRNYFYLNINEGSGDIDLAIHCNILKNKFSNGTSHVALKGIVGYAEHVTRSYGLIDASKLQTNIAVVESSSTNDVYVWAESKLDVQLYSIGNIYYKGNPAISVNACTNDGRLIPWTEP